MADKNSRNNLFSLICFLIILTGILGLAFVLILPYLVALLMGAILAILINPIYLRLSNKFKKKGLAGITVILGLLILVVGPVFIFSAVAIKQGVILGKEISDQGLLSSETIASRIGGWDLIEPYIQDLDSFEGFIRMQINKLGPVLTQLALKLLSDIPSFFLQVLITLLGCFFFLIDGKRLIEWVGPKIPLDTDVKDRLKSSFLETSLGVIWATVAAAATQSVIVTIGFLVLGVPNVILAMGATFISAWIPLVGCSPVWISGLVYLLSRQLTGRAIAMLIVGIVVGVIDNFVRSLVLKGRGNMHPLVSLVAVFGGIALFGASGIFTGPIIMALIIAILDVWPLVAQRMGIMSSS